jgi:hypothetical protein
MLSRIPPVRKTVPLVTAVFVFGAGVGVAIIALTSGSTTTKKIVVRHVVNPTFAPSAQVPAADPRSKSRHRPKPPRPHAAIQANRSLVSSDAAASFATLAGGVGGPVGIAVAPLGRGPIRTLGSLQEGHAWSTMKVPVLATLLRDDERRGQTLSPQAQQDATLALEQSDNSAAEALFSTLEQTHGGLVGASQAVQHTLGDAGDLSTTINTAPNSEGFTTWGQSIWSTRGEIHFYRGLARGCVLNPSDTAYVLGLMRNVISSQRWGAGAAGYPAAVPLAFKAGWGPESGGGYLVRQTAIVGSGSRGYVMSAIALPSNGSFSQGVSMITAVATWAREHLNLDANRSPAQCNGAS